MKGERKMLLTGANVAAIFSNKDSILRETLHSNHSVPRLPSVV